MAGNRRPLGCPASPSLLSVYVACLIRPTHLHSPMIGRINTTNVKHFGVAGWRGGLVVGRQTCDLVVAGSRPGRDAAA